MRIQAYTAYDLTLTVTAATPRPEMTASTKFTAAGIHTDFCARVRAVLKEHKHITPTDSAYPAAKRLQAYFPTDNAGRPLFAIRELKPAGAPRDIDADFMLEVMRIRFSVAIDILPTAWSVDELIAEAIERHVEYAVKKLFAANQVPDSFIPSGQGLRPGDRTEIDIICELGPATARMGIDIPAPSTT